MIEVGLNLTTMFLKLIPTLIEPGLRRRRPIPRFRNYLRRRLPGRLISLSFYSFRTSYASSTAKAGWGISLVQV